MCGFNCENVVENALGSVAVQDYPHELMEIVFVDDGSKDNTRNVVKEFLTHVSIPSKIISCAWGGLGKARNKVINNASGDYIVWVDSDEVLSPDFVRIQIKAIELNPKAGIVAPQLGLPCKENVLLALELLPNIVEYSRQDWKGHYKFPGTGGSTFRVVAVRDVGGFNEGIEKVGEDIEVASRIKRYGWEIVKGDGVLYETHGGLCSVPNLFKRSYTQGIQARQLYQKNRTFYSLGRINPFASAVVSIFYAINGYKLTRRKIAFLVPLHFSLKMLIFFYGFCKV